ncbi:MAG: 3-phosphoshikimate 1-carboxyvinyltransferase [Rhodothermales bacterium]
MTWGALRRWYPMHFHCQESTLTGRVRIPGSKSHTIRGVLLGSLADGESTLLDPLASEDTRAAVGVYRQLGAEIDQQVGVWRIRGIGHQPRLPDGELDVLNSGTTMSVSLGTCSLLPEGEAILTGDAQIQRRPAAPLVQALNDLGADISSDTGDFPPFRVRGPLRGGHTSIECSNSQYLTSLLLACPFAPGDSDIDVPLLYERPYVGMTLDWLDGLGITVERRGWEHFHVPGGQSLQPFTRRIAADFSSATFFLAAGALGNNSIACEGLDMTDSQSDKAVVDFLRQMGANVDVSDEAIRVSAAPLTGIDIDMNDCPDALPMMAVVGCFARGTTRLLNVPQARIKETDRIAVMACELRKLGADIEELEDGLVIRESSLRGAEVNGHHDHRVVMSLAIAGSLIGNTRIATAEAAAITFPTFSTLYSSLGGNIEGR